MKKIAVIGEITNKLSYYRPFKNIIGQHQHFLMRYLKVDVDYKIIRYTKNEQIELVEKAKNGDLASRDKLWESCYPLVYWLAKRMILPAELAEDCIQEGLLGIPEAIELYDPNKNCLFTTYLIYHIFKKIQNLLWGQRFFLKYPAYFYGFLMKYVRLRGLPNDDPKKEAFKKKYNIESFDNISLFPMQFRKAILLSASIQENNFSFVACLDDSHRLSDAADNLWYLEYAMNNILKDKERDLIKLYFGFNQKRKTYRQISKIYNLSHERVRQIIIQSCAKLKRYLDKKNILSNK